MGNENFDKIKLKQFKQLTRISDSDCGLTRRRGPLPGFGFRRTWSFCGCKIPRLSNLWGVGKYREVVKKRKNRFRPYNSQYSKKRSEENPVCSPNRKLQSGGFWYEIKAPNPVAKSWHFSGFQSSRRNMKFPPGGKETNDRSLMETNCWVKENFQSPQRLRETRLGKPRCEPIFVPGESRSQNKIARKPLSANHPGWKGPR